MEGVSYPKTGFYTKLTDYSSSNPDKPAVIYFKKQTASYIEMKKCYDSLNEFFHINEIEPTDRIAIITANELSVAMLVMPIIDNAVVVTVDPDKSISELEIYFSRAKVDYIITDDISSSGYSAAVNFGIGVILFDTNYLTDNISFKFSLLHQIKKSSRTPDPDEIKYIMIKTTSGTTGEPKLVPTTARSIEDAVNRMGITFQFSEKDVTLIVTTIYKAIAIYRILYSLMHYGTLVVMDGFNHARLIEVIEKHNITNFTAAPAVLSSFASYAENNSIEIADSTLRFVRASGAPMAMSLYNRLEKVLGTEIVMTYGSHETLNITCTYRAPKGFKEGSVGVSTGPEIKLLNNELLIKGESVFPGYENQEINNDDYFTDGWFHTGDIGYIDEDSYVFITGRIKEMINRGGEKISPYEVETIIMKHPDIIDCAVFPYLNNYESENVGAVIVLNAGSTLKLKSLRSFLSSSLTSYKMPTLLYIVDEIPKSENGKVQRNKLYSHLIKSSPSGGVSLETEHFKASNNLTKSQKRMRSIWRHALNSVNIGVEDVFTEVGGDSLNGARVLSDIENKFKIKIPVNILFEGGTIKGLTAFIEAEYSRRNNFRHLVPVKVTGDKKPLICIHSGLGDATTYRHIGKYFNKDRPVYALRFDMRNTKWPHPITFDLLAEKYIKDIKRLDQEGPYFICGNCWGGVLAYKIASELIAGGSEVGMLALFDSADKTNGRKKDKNIYQLRSRFRIVFKESLDQLRGVSLKKKIRLIIKKSFNIVNLVYLTQNKKIYKFAQTRNYIWLMKLMGKSGALGFAYDKFMPEKYSGKVHYFKAIKGRSGISNGHKYWKGVCNEFEMIEMNCHHNEMVTGANSMELAEILNDIMRGSDD